MSDRLVFYALHSNEQLAADLERWADIREGMNGRRAAQGKRPLDGEILREAARRLRAHCRERL